MSDVSNISGTFPGSGDCPYEAGDTVEKSGIYALCHADGTSGTLVLLRGNRFPDCPCCGARARYRLLRGAPYIFEDADFSPSA